MIGVCGYGYTGSGAVIDILKEFEDVSVNDDMEFDFLYMPDGVEDLYYHLCQNPVRYLSGNTAVKRFINFINIVNTPHSAYNKATNGQFYSLSRQFINSLVQCKWKGIDIYEKINCSPCERLFKYRIVIRLNLLLEKIRKKKIVLTPYEDMFLAVNPKNFISAAKTYVNEIISSMNVDSSKNLVLNQPFPSNVPLLYFKYFEDPKAIIVDKDPRDLYLLAKYFLKSDGSFIPTDNVGDFITYYKNMHNKMDNKSVLYISFEDLIFKYEDSLKIIEDFCQIKYHSKKLKYFDPDISINNTALFKRYNYCPEDIKKIENLLPEYLYNFPSDVKIQKKHNPF